MHLEFGAAMVKLIKVVKRYFQKLIGLPRFQEARNILVHNVGLTPDRFWSD